MKNNVRALITLIGIVFGIIGAAIVESESIIPSIVCFAIAFILTAPTIFGEIKREFT